MSYTLRQHGLRDYNQSLSKIFQKKLYSIQNKQILLQHIRANPKNTYNQIIIACRLKYKPSTIKKILKKYNITN